MDHSKTDAAPPANPRRRLLRGAFAAPAVMTLISGSAFAAQSAVQCVKSKATGTTPSFPGVGAADTWVRVQRYKLNIGSGASPNWQYWINGSDVIAKRGSKTSLTSFLASNQFMLLASPYTKQTSSPTSGTNTLVIDTGYWCALRIDKDGNILGVVGDGGSTSGTSAIAGTCWTSFLAS